VALAERANGPIPRHVRPEYVWGDALAAIEAHRPRARIINLETTATLSEDVAPKEVTYRMHPANVDVLTAGGIDCCVLANNHMGDWGRQGLLDTLDNLARAHIPFAGAGRSRDEAAAPVILPIGADSRVAVFAFGCEDSGIPPEWAAGPTRPGVNLLPDLSDRTIDDIAALIDRTTRARDIVVASIHWGANWGFDIPASHRRFAHALIERAFVDIVHGHSSHHPKAIEVHRGRAIFYGCGDLLNDYEGIVAHELYRDDLPLLYVPTVDAASGELQGLEMIPMRIRRFRLEHPGLDDRVAARDMMDAECRRFGRRVTLRDDMLVLGVG
jgi:poly-gamma-glutamate synthesis protein (capsule biosynthesis protein)